MYLYGFRYRKPERESTVLPQAEAYRSKASFPWTPLEEALPIFVSLFCGEKNFDVINKCKETAINAES